VKPTKEELAEERAFQDRLELAALESLTHLSVEDLGHWNLRSYAFKNLDQHIDRATSDEKPHLERLFLLLLIFKCLNRLLEPPKPKQPESLAPLSSSTANNSASQSNASVNTLANMQGGWQK
jgi:hypothetical protein